jgi:hypothetical protein
MSAAANLTVMYRIVAEVFNARNLDAAEDLVALDWCDHTPLPGQGQGREGFRQYAQAFLNACASWKLIMTCRWKSGQVSSRVLTPLLALSPQLVYRHPMPY